MPCGGHNSQAGAVAAVAGGAAVEVAAVVPAAVVPLMAEVGLARPAAFTDEPDVPDIPVTEVAAGPTRLIVGVPTVADCVALEGPAVLVVVVVCAAAESGKASKTWSADHVIRCRIPARKCLVGITRL
ncbi:MAG: hypothetical protein JO007_03220 [Alphaproteobacteria bacterium]|nr:hypothetical protein [Alphaproteobacteria bacterium]